jgi:hypothetical protein
MKPSHRPLSRGLRLVSLMLLAWASLQGTLWASAKQNIPDAPPPETGANWVAGYAIVLLGIVLGLLVSLRSSNRQDPSRAGGVGGMTPEDLQAAVAAAAAAKGGKKPPAQWGPELAPDAKTSLTMAIVGVVIPVAGLGLGPFAIWKALQARKAIQQSAHLTGDNIAVAGLATGIGAAVVGLIWLITLIVMAVR